MWSSRFIATLCVATLACLLGCDDSVDTPPVDLDAGLATGCGGSCGEGQSCEVNAGDVTCLPSCEDGWEWDAIELQCVRPPEPPAGCEDCESESACEEATCNESGACVTTPVDCDDGDPCTVDLCDPETGCSSEPLCVDDGDACNVPTCDPETGACGTAPVACEDDGDACTVEACDPETGCTSTPLVCEDDGDACTVEACDPETGCTSEPLVWDDSDACTVEACDPETGCTSTPLACEDDGDVCTVEACDPETGCTSTPLVCEDDGDPCTVEACDKEAGCTSTPLVCDDGDACTVGACDPEFGCVYEPVVCPDLDLCNVGVCDPETGCGFAARTCDDGDACTDDLCDSVEGCVHPTRVCDDEDICTDDACDPLAGCVATPIECPDQNACSVGICVPGTGCGFEPVVCDDGNPCTRDNCDPASGCFSSTEECDDATPCEVGVCVTGVGCEYVGRDCDDGNPCTADFCESAFGCVNEPIVCAPSNACFDSATCDPETGACVDADPNTGPCDDGIRCTSDDSCDGFGVCVGGTTVSCTEPTPCPQSIAFFEDRPLIASKPVARIAPFDASTGERLSPGADPGNGLAGTIYTLLNGEDAFDVATGETLPANTVGEPSLIASSAGALPGIAGVAAFSLRGLTLDQNDPADYFVDPAAPGDEIRIYRGGEVSLWAYDASGATYTLAALYTDATMTLTVTWSAGRIVGSTRGELTIGSRAYPLETIEASITGFVECAARTTETNECYATYNADAAVGFDLCTAPPCRDFVCEETSGGCVVEELACD